MKEILLKINEHGIYDRIKKESSKSAIIKNSAGQDSKTSALSIITEDDKKIIDEYIYTAVNECVILITHNLGPCKITRYNSPDDTQHKTYNFSIIAPENYPEEIVTALNDTVMNIVLNRTLQQWYMLVKSDDANICNGKIQLYMKQMQEALSLRKKP